MRPSIYYLLAVGMAFCCNNTAAQTFQNTYGGTGNDIGNDVIEIGQDYLIAGGTSSAGNGGMDATIMLVDNSGNLIWQKCFGNAGDELFHFVRQTSDLGFICLGEFKNTGQNFRNIFVVKTDQQGALEWSKFWNTNFDDFPTALTVTPDGIIISGLRQIGSSNQSILIRLDSNGNEIWNKIYSNSVNNLIRCEYVDGQVGILSGAIDEHACFAKLNLTDGTVYGIKNYRGSNTEALYHLDPTADSMYIMSNHSWSPSGGAQLQQWVQKITQTGEVIWSNTYRITGRNIRGNIEATSDLGFLLTSWDNAFSNASRATLIKLDQNGQVEWAYDYEGNYGDRLSKSIETANGNFLSVGYSRSSSNGAHNDILLVKTDQNGQIDGCNPMPPVVTRVTYKPPVIDISSTENPYVISEQLAIQMDVVGNTLTEAICEICPDTTIDVDISLCPNDTFELNGNLFTAPNLVLDTVSGAGNCDTIFRYLLSLIASGPTLSLGPDIILCQDSTVILDAGPGFTTYLWQDGSNAQTFAATTFGTFWVEVTDTCGTVQRDSVLITPSLLADVKLADTTLCAGDAYTLTVPGFDSYTWAPADGLSCTDCPTVTIQPAQTTTYTLLATTTAGCVLDDTFTVTIMPLLIISDTLEFCPGESVSIGGQTYTQPGMVTDTIPDPNGCPLVFIYVLRYATTPNSSISIECVEDINIATIAGTGAVPVDYDLPTAGSDCPCPGVALTLTEGLPPGSLFPVAKTLVCYEARDSCGNVDTCCFHVIVREALPCDSKEIGCMRWELLRISQNAAKERTYRIRVINKCVDPMIYTAFELPDGTKAVKPADNSVYTTPDGRDYLVRNPNFSPFYSIRFKSLSDSIANNEADIFEYTLPPQSEPDYIHVTARLAPQQFFEAYLNTFNCPVEPESKPEFKENGFGAVNAVVHGNGLRVFPNPTTGMLFADLSDFREQAVQVRIFDATGRLVQQLQLTADVAPQAIQLGQDLPEGLYVLEVQNRAGDRQAVRFVLLR